MRGGTKPDKGMRANGFNVYLVVLCAVRADERAECGARRERREPTHCRRQLLLMHFCVVGRRG